MNRKHLGKIMNGIRNKGILILPKIHLCKSTKNTGIFEVN